MYIDEYNQIKIKLLDKIIFMRGQKNWFLYTRFINTVENISCCLARVKMKFSKHCEKFDTWNKVVSNVVLPESFSSKLGISPDSEAYPFFRVQSIPLSINLFPR